MGRFALITVVGAGIVGASIAYHLAAAGAAVTLVDRAPAPAAGATGSSFGWIGDGEGGDWPGAADDLRPLVLADHRRLAAAVPGYEVRWTGSLHWTRSSPGGPGHPREPRLRVTPADPVFRPGDGGVDPVAATRALTAACEQLGGRVRYGVPVTRPEPPVVLAAGTGIPALGAGVPVRSSPALLVRATAPPGLVRTIVVTPEFEVREVRDGSLLIAAAAGADPAALIERVRAAVGGPVHLTGSSIGDRPMPAGGPIIGYVSAGVYAAVMHSGVTLAPAVGRLVARELTTGVRPPELSRAV